MAKKIEPKARPIIPPRPDGADKWNPYALDEKGRPIIPPRPDVADKWNPITLDEKAPEETGTKVVNITINL